MYQPGSGDTPMIYKYTSSTKSVELPAKWT